MRYIKERNEIFYQEIDKQQYQNYYLSKINLSKYDIEMCVSFLKYFERKGYDIGYVRYNEIYIQYGGSIFGKALSINKLDDDYYLIKTYQYLAGSSHPEVYHYYHCDGYTGLIDCIKTVTLIETEMSRGSRYKFDSYELSLFESQKEKNDSFSYRYDEKIEEIFFTSYNKKYSITKPLENFYIVYEPDKVKVILGKHQQHNYLFEYLLGK